jgi:hypothetical protein
MVIHLPMCACVQKTNQAIMPEQGMNFINFLLAMLIRPGGEVEADFPFRRIFFLSAGYRADPVRPGSWGSSNFI